MPKRYPLKTPPAFAKLVLCSLLLFSGCSRTASLQVIEDGAEEKQKIAAPFSISYQIPDRIAVNEPISVTITCRVEKRADELVLTIKAGEGLKMTGAGEERRYGSRRAKSVLTKSIILTANNEGLYYLNVSISGTFHGRRMTRAGAVPVTVGEYERQEAFRKKVPLMIDQAGQPIITLPAQEGTDK